MKKISPNSILVRLFLSFLLVISPIISAGVVMFMWERQTIQSQIEDSALENVSFLKSNLESEIGNVKLLQYNLDDDNTLLNLITQYPDLPKYDYYTLVGDVQERLRIMKNSNNYISNVILYIPKTKHIVSAQNGYSSWDETGYKNILSIQLNAHYPLIINSSDILSVSAYPLYISENTTPMFLAEVVLSGSEVRSFLGKFSKYNISDTALYDYTSKNWIFDSQSNIENSDDAQASLIKDHAKNLSTVLNINGENYYVVSVYSNYLNVSIVQYVPIEDIFSVPDRFSNFLWFYALLAILIMLAYSWYTYKFVKYPVCAVLEAFQRVQEGDLNVRVRLKAANEFNDLFEGFNNMVFRLNELINRVYRQELYAKKSELKQLQSQINPHFLYNSYFMLHRMIKDRDMENAETLSAYLGKYFQYITRNASEEATLQKEYEHARSYALIQQMRFSDRISVEFEELPEKYRNFMVPRIILQPILENAFSHGFKNAVQNGLIRVTFKDTGSGLLIFVEDSGGNLMDDDIGALRKKLAVTDDTAETTGIVNVHRRLALRYGPGSGISVSRSVLGGLKVKIQIESEHPGKLQ